MNNHYPLKAWLSAYRKAKVDMFYSTYCDKIALAQYEENLISNLKSLQQRFDICCTNHDFSAFHSKNFLGGFYFVGKNYESASEKTSKPEVTFRLMAKPSIDFHILSALWVQHIGTVFEKSFKEEFSVLYANRVRITQKGENSFQGLGSFLPYSIQYGKWKQQAINTINIAKENKRPCTIICLDVSNFYYSVNPMFLFHRYYYEQLQDREQKLHECFCSVLEAWNNGVFSKQLKKPLGLPVGLAASGMVANLALMEFDNIVMESCSPIHYGRYVDDILVVLADNKKLKEIDDFFYILKNQCLDGIIFKQDNDQDIWNYLINDSTYSFNTSKTQIIHVNDEKTTAIFDVFVQQLHERTSEWRALPQLPPKHLLNPHFIQLIDDSSEISQKIVDIKNLVVKSSRFGFLLRDCENITRVLLPCEWQEVRRCFIDAYTAFVIEEKLFMQFEKYLHRVIELGVLCDDYESIKLLFEKLGKTIEALFSHSNIKIAGEFECSTLCDEYKKYLNTVIRQAVLLASPNQYYPRLCEELSNSTWLCNGFGDTTIPTSKVYEKCFLFDLAYFPTKSIIISFEQTPLALYDFGKKILETFKIDVSFLEYWKKLDNLIIKKEYRHVSTSDSVSFREKLTHYLQFPTRPMNEYDMFFSLDDLSQGQSLIYEEFEKILYLFRGYCKTHHTKNELEQNKNIFKVPLNGFPSKTINIAIASISMESEKLDFIIRGLPTQKTLERYQRFTALINSILKSSERIDYVVFPELALPSRWFIQAAHKLFKAKINIISGIEYISYTDNSDNQMISNQVWASLRHSLFDYDSYIVLRQKKLIPAYKEQEDITKKSSFHWEPAVEKNIQTENNPWPIVIQHGDFFFAILICSELLNIEYRNHLRGKIDSLVIPEWNSDIATFNDLINSTATDLHAYIVQCNNNQYGDCRIRAPYKKEYERDIIKAKGGINDYFLIGKIDIDALRQFQHRSYPDDSPKVLFKPFPIGYKMSPKRILSLTKRLATK
ncbi:MAG: RNA-directed DNA polymerase [Sphaerochaetaceae bacterium]|nr:RNA-directed DNA polymerase [Sphaerochaetaceae bacterium]